MLKIYKYGKCSRKYIQLKHSRKFADKKDPCCKPCPPVYECKQSVTNPDLEKWLALFTNDIHPFLRCCKRKDYRPYRNLTLFVCLPICACMFFYIHFMEQPKKRPKFIKYEHMRIRNKPFPWDPEGKRSLFHNPYYNALPDGYEFEVPEDEEFDPNSSDCELKKP